MLLFIKYFLWGCLIADAAGIVGCLIIGSAFLFMEKMNKSPAPENLWRDLHGMFRIFTFGLFKRIPL